jgi:hypothetical protein
MKNMDQQGGGPYLTKDEFHKFVIDNRDRQDANKREIMSEIRQAFDDSRTHCEEADNRVIERVEKLEGNAYAGKIIATVLGALASIATAISIFWRN